MMKALLTLSALCCAMLLPALRSGFAKTNDIAGRSTQMIVVTTPEWNAVQGRMQRYERTSPGAAWQPVGDSIAIVVGKSGMAWGSGLIATDSVRASGDPVKREGDGRSPAGVFSLGTAFGYALDPLTGTKLPYLSLTGSIECVDDVDSSRYNRIVDRSSVTPDWKSSEHMRETGEAYRWGIVVNHNAIANPDGAPQPVRGAGSCIFLHIWKDSAHGTAGCTAMQPAQIETLLEWLDPKRTPVLVQLPVDAYARGMKQWGLPAVMNLPAR
jgi:L,D-peptidoglycan transpeptidase YkuD (ErfK/YbiS/YcfS/YnhG family)